MTGFHREKYEKINRQVAEEVAKLVREDTLIWVHDYHFLMVGTYLKQLGVKCPIGFFLHTPFPASFSIECIPRHAELFGHMLSYDLLGFQTGGDQRSFLRYANRSLFITQVDDDTVKSAAGTTYLGAFPVGINVDDYVTMAAIAQNDPQVAKLRSTIGESSTIIGVDRLDYSKGLPQRFRAYERLLADFPERRENVTFLQIAPLTRSDVFAYKSLQEELASLTGRINGRFGNASWQPIRYTNESYPSPVLAGFYGSCEVCYVTPLRDGMNLVAKEFVACQPESDPGVLVLSQFAGRRGGARDRADREPLRYRGGVEGARAGAFHVARRATGPLARHDEGATRQRCDGLVRRLRFGPADAAAKKTLVPTFQTLTRRRSSHEIQASAARSCARAPALDPALQSLSAPQRQPAGCRRALSAHRGDGLRLGVPQSRAPHLAARAACMPSKATTRSTHASPSAATCRWKPTFRC